MPEGLTFPESPQDGQTISFSFTHTGGDANNAQMTRTWSWNDSQNAWVSNYNNSVFTPTTNNRSFGSISGNSKNSGIARWDYAVYNADFNGSSWVISSPSVTATNLLEVQNTGTTAYGISVTGDQGITLSGFTGFAIMPAPNGTLVELIYKGGNYFFSAPNPIDGIC